MSRQIHVLSNCFAFTCLLLGTAFAQVETSPQEAGTLARGQIDRGEPIPLQPRTAAEAPTAKPASRGLTGGGALTTVVGALAVCLGIFFLFVWATRKQRPSGTARLPTEVVELLGRTPLMGRQHLQLLRIGRKLLLLDVTPSGAETLTEITDPAEVDRLIGLCQQARPGSVTASFREVLTDYESVPAKGFLGAAKLSDWELAAAGTRKRPNRRGDSDE